MYRDLIIGFDDSPPARDAVAFARRLALATGARPMAVYSSAAAWDHEGKVDDEHSAATDADIDAKCSAAKRLLAGVPDATFEAVAEPSPALALQLALPWRRYRRRLRVQPTHRTGIAKSTCWSSAPARVGWLQPSRRARRAPRC